MSVLVKYFFYLLSILLILDCFCYYYFNLSFYGYYADAILFWLWLFSSFVAIIVFWKKLIAKLFLVAIIIVLILSIIPLMLPFFKFIYSTTSLGLRLDKDLTENYRAQIVYYDALAAPRLEIIKKYGIFEKKIIELSQFEMHQFDYLNDEALYKYEAELIDKEQRIGDAKDIFFTSETDTTLTITLFYDGPNKILTFDKKKNKLKEVIIN